MLLFDLLGGIILFIGALAIALAAFVLYIYGGIYLVLWILRKLPPLFPAQKANPGVVDLTKKALDCYIKKNRENL